MEEGMEMDKWIWNGMEWNEWMEHRGKCRAKSADHEAWSFRAFSVAGQGAHHRRVRVRRCADTTNVGRAGPR